MSTVAVERRTRQRKRAIIDDNSDSEQVPAVKSPPTNRRSARLSKAKEPEQKPIEPSEVEIVQVEDNHDLPGSPATQPPKPDRLRKLNETVTKTEGWGESEKKAVQKRSRAQPEEAKPRKKSKAAVHEVTEVDDGIGEELDSENNEVPEEDDTKAPKKRRAFTVNRENRNTGDDDCCLIGDPIPDHEARELWPKRYQKKKNGSWSITNGAKASEEEEPMMALRHFSQAKVDETIYNLNDHTYVKAADGELNYIGRIIELFEGIDGQPYFRAQWFYRAVDTVIKQFSDKHKHDQRRVFLSEDQNDNPLNCIVSKIHIAKISPNIDLMAKEGAIPSCDYYYDMTYSEAYATFACRASNERALSETSSVTSSEEVKKSCGGCASSSAMKAEYSLLDLYSGCGAMSTGLCLGSKLSRLNLETKWAVDLSPYACESLRLNHPKTQVRNEQAEDFLTLLREWEKMCKRFSVIGADCPPSLDSEDDDVSNGADAQASSNPSGEFEVEKFVGICYGDPNKINKKGLMFKVRWKGYGPSDDTWEPVDGLSKCKERIESFVRNGYNRNILPLPGSVDVICGGPPCQGVSGFNRFRNANDPLKDEKNHQLEVFMDIVEFLKPKYVLMENVVDILKFAKGYLGRYALSRLVKMNYQSRLGMMVAGCYGLPQFRMRVFLWGALPTMALPQFPLPTHNVVVRGGFPNEFEHSIVAYEEGQFRKLEQELHLGDAISDLPPVENNELTDEMPYSLSPETEFQQFIRLSREELTRCPKDLSKSSLNKTLYDHRPLQLNEDDFLRVCQIPKKKGANFRDLPGVAVGDDNVVYWDPTLQRVFLPSGKPLVPDYAMSFVKGKSSKPFGRLWWDETVPTVVTRAEPHNQIILHPLQDRVLTIRENARLQGFPDFYQLKGPVKERYIQVGNAVAVPVARALGFALGLAYQDHRCNDGSVFTLPSKFPLIGCASDDTMEADESVELPVQA